MGFFSKGIDLDKVISAVILEQTQNYKKSKAKAGLVFSNSILNPDVVLMDGGTEPDGCTYTFSVTFKDGTKKIVKADSGTSLCDQLLQIAMDYGGEENSVNSELKEPRSAPAIEKNQLPQGIYIIGKDIPCGTYDFHLVWGNGRLELYNAPETILGNLKFGEWVGNRETYEKPDCINVFCSDGDYLHITGNLIVSIEKSKEVNIDL